jgi:sulfotransferase
MERIHFISGLPRSGSTLLAAILRQNSHFQASMSGPVAGALCGLLGGMGANMQTTHSFLGSPRSSATACCELCLMPIISRANGKVVFDTTEGGAL